MRKQIYKVQSTIYQHQNSTGYYRRSFAISMLFLLYLFTALLPMGFRPFWTTAFCQTVTYDIPLANLTGQASTCAANSYYAFGGTPGFTWTSTGSGSVTALTILVNIGVDCHAAATSHTGTLNGTGSGSATPPLAPACACPARDNIMSYSPPVGAYVVGGANAFTTSSTTNYGQSINTTWPAGTYARVIVTYTSAAGAPRIATGGNHSFALCSDGTIWAWGYNGDGEVGDNTVTTPKLTAVQVLGGASGSAYLTGISVAAGGANHSVAVRNDGTVWAWGYNGTGPLGDGTNNQRNTPVQVLKGAAPGATYLTGITAIACGSNHVLAVKNDGTLWSWGWNDKGQLGDNTTTSRNAPVQVLKGAAPGATYLTGIIAAAGGGINGGGGDSYSLALKNDGTVWSWGGNNSVGQLGINSTTTTIYTPVQVLGGASGSTYLTGITAIAAHRASSLAVKNDGTVWSWGYNGQGQLGDNTNTNRWTPTQVLGGASGSAYLTGITSVANGWIHSLALKNDGTVWAWGYNFYGQLGDNTGANKWTPVQVLGGASGSTYLTGITTIEAGTTYSLALKNDGTVWAWGDNGNGQLGDGTTTNRWTPVQSIGLCSVGPLPVELLYFNAYRDGAAMRVRCDWITATELNNDYFAVQRSKEGSVFSQIGTVKGAGNSSITQYYTFYDHEPYSGLSYYRLKQVDYNGAFEYSPIRAVYIGTMEIITIYPNPSSEYIHYTIASETGGGVTVKLYDALGREVLYKEETIEAGVTTNKLPTAALSSGSYLLRITTKTQEKTQKQFVVR